MERDWLILPEGEVWPEPGMKVEPNARDSDGKKIWLTRCEAAFEMNVDVKTIDRWDNKRKMKVWHFGTPYIYAPRLRSPGKSGAMSVIVPVPAEAA